ncbi:MAG: SMC-Scp complex subunit ScpB [Bdellovibrionia bacterium]
MTEKENNHLDSEQNSQDMSAPEDAPQHSEKKQNDDGVSYVSLISDPYGFTNNEVSEAQDSSEPLNLDEPQDEFEDDFEDDEDTGMNMSESASEDDETEVSAISMADLRAQAQAETAAQSESDSAIESFEVDTEEFVAAEDNGALDRLAGAITEQTEKDRIEAEELVAKAAEALADWTPDADAKAAMESANQLASQIAEDQALQAELAKEAEEAEQIDPALAAALPQRGEDGSLDLNELQSAIEAILFMVDKPISMARIHEMLGPDFELNLFQEAMSALMDRYQSTAHGVEIVQVANGYQFRTKAGRAALVKKLAKVQTQRLSSGAMESLAIIAYRQPVLKDDIDKIRGVDSSYFIRQLLDKKLIHISGRSELVGRPLLYSTTDEFLSLFNLKDLSAMPSLREIEQMIPASQSQNPEDEDPRVKEMRKLVGQMKSDTSVSLIYDAREDEKILKDIKERVGSIATTTPYLEQQKEIEKQTAEAAKHGMTLEEWGAAQAAAAAAKEAEKAAAKAGSEEAPEMLPEAAPSETPAEVPHH